MAVDWGSWEVLTSSGMKLSTQTLYHQSFKTDAAATIIVYAVYVYKIRDSKE